MNIYLQGGIILAIVAALFGAYLFFANRRAKRNIADARQRSADSRASLTSSPTPSLRGSNKSNEQAKKKRARKLASQQRRRNRR